MLAAAAGYVPAIAGALSQELVDLATILNALRALSPGRHGAASPVLSRKEAAGPATGDDYFLARFWRRYRDRRPVSRLPRSAAQS